MIEVTAIAIKEAKRILDSQDKQDWGIRLGVKGGGCSGLEYIMNIEEKPKDNDKINEIDGVKVFTDPKSYLYLNGLELDFSNDLMGGGFRFNNPNATQTCSCGQSFSA